MYNHHFLALQIKWNLAEWMKAVNIIYIPMSPFHRTSYPQHTRKGIQKQHRK